MLLDELNKEKSNPIPEISAGEVETRPFDASMMNLQGCVLEPHMGVGASDSGDSMASIPEDTYGTEGTGEDDSSFMNDSRMEAMPNLNGSQSARLADLDEGYAAEQSAECHAFRQEIIEPLMIQDKYLRRRCFTVNEENEYGRRI